MEAEQLLIKIHSGEGLEDSDRDEIVSMLSSVNTEQLGVGVSIDDILLSPT